MAAAQTNQAGKDFVLFDEPGPFTVAPAAPAVSTADWHLINQPMGWPSHPNQSTLSSAAGAHPTQFSTSQPGQGGMYAPISTSGHPPIMAARPSIDSNPSFTQYRNVPAPTESPFSSPATRPEEDFSSSPANSTLDPRSGLPNKKRARGHAHSSSWAGPMSGGAGPSEFGARPSTNRFSHSAVPGLGVQPSPETFGQLGFPFGGEGDGFGNGLQGLSLGDQSGAMGFSTLFPEMSGQGADGQSGSTGATPEQQRQAQNLLAMSMAATSSSSSAGAVAPVYGLGDSNDMYGQNIIYTPTEPLDGVTPTPANFARQRQFLQAREDLSGVDPRALRGPLRDAQQAQHGAANHMSGLDRNWQTDGGQQQRPTFDPRAFDIGQSDRPSHPARQRSGSLDTKTSAEQQSGGGDAPSSQPLPAPTSEGSTWNTLAGQLQQMFAPGVLPSGQGMARARSSQHPTQRKMSQQKRASISGQSPATGGRPPMLRDRSGLTVSPQETLLDYQAPHGATYSLFNLGVPGLAESIAAANAARVRESSSSSSPSEAGPETPQASSFARRDPLDRNDTVRPGLRQQVPLEDRRRSSATSETPSNDDASQSSGSGPSLFSPSAVTFGTPSTHDEDATYHPQRLTSKRNDRAQQVGPHGAGPRFGDVSSSSSESDSESASSLRGRGLPGAALGVPGQRMHGMTGYGQMAGSSESGMSIQPSVLATARNGNVQSADHQGQGWRSRSASTSQSQDDDGSISPSIRSSAQVIPPPLGFASALHAHAQPQAPASRDRSRSRTRKVSQEPAGHVGEDDDDDAWEDGTEPSEEGSDYAPDFDGKPSTAVGASRTKGAASSQKRRRPKGPSRGPSIPGGGPSSAAMHSAANAAGITKCDYVSHVTGELCGTEFHRPYDLARHRETIHGKEEAALLRQGAITKEQCMVLYKEVDPAKSLATVEWRCDGRNGCGSVFSRKDALLRHRRIRGHLK